MRKSSLILQQKKSIVKIFFMFATLLLLINLKAKNLAFEEIYQDKFRNKTAEKL